MNLLIRCAFQHLCRLDVNEMKIIIDVKSFMSLSSKNDKIRKTLLVRASMLGHRVHKMA